MDSCIQLEDTVDHRENKFSSEGTRENFPQLQPGYSSLDAHQSRTVHKTQQSYIGLPT